LSSLDSIHHCFSFEKTHHTQLKNTFFLKRVWFENLAADLFDESLLRLGSLVTVYVYNPFSLFTLNFKLLLVSTISTKQRFDFSPKGFVGFISNLSIMGFCFLSQSSKLSCGD
jgi:hypothetical protein